VTEPWGAKLDRRLGVATLAIAAALAAGSPARADDLAPTEPRLFLRLAAGPGFGYESWTPEGGSAGASSTGWAPVLDVAVGRRVRPRLVVAGELQLAAIVDRTESYRGGSYPLVDTLHFVDTLSAIADYTLWRYPRLHAGGGVGLMAMTAVDGHMGSTATSWGFALGAHAGYRRPLSHTWSIGVMGRVICYRFASDTPRPSATSTGVLPSLLLTFTR
jgi:hypothetical protein